MKHTIIMIFLLILALCSICIASANENIAVYCDDAQTSFSENEIKICEIEYEENFALSSNSIKNENFNYANDKNVITYENLNMENSNKDINLDVFELAKTDGKITEHILNEKINSSNEYVTYNNGNLLMLPLIKTDLNIEIGESPMIFNEKNMISGHGDLKTDDYWNESIVTGLSSNENITLIKRSLLPRFINNQKINNYPQNDLPLDYASTELLGVSRDFDDDAFIWYNQNPYEMAFVTVDMVNKSTDKTLDLNLNEKNQDILPFEIGVNSTLKALDYFKTQGIDVQKSYPYLYVLTSAGQVKINEKSTFESIEGILEVLGSELYKNIYSVHIPSWKDLIFFYLWVNDTNIKDMRPYALKYDIDSNALRGFTIIL